MTVKRGDIYYADLSPVIGSEQGGIRPVLIVQNDVGNKFSPTVIAAAITSQKDKTKLPQFFGNENIVGMFLDDTVNNVTETSNQCFIILRVIGSWD